MNTTLILLCGFALGILFGFILGTDYIYKRWIKSVEPLIDSIIKIISINRECLNYVKSVKPRNTEKSKPKSDGKN